MCTCPTTRPGPRRIAAGPAHRCCPRHAAADPVHLPPHPGCPRPAPAALVTHLLRCRVVGTVQLSPAKTYLAHDSIRCQLRFSASGGGGGHGVGGAVRLLVRAAPACRATRAGAVSPRSARLLWRSHGAGPVRWSALRSSHGPGGARLGRCHVPAVAVSDGVALRARRRPASPARRDRVARGERRPRRSRHWPEGWAVLPGGSPGAVWSPRASHCPRPPDQEPRGGGLPRDLGAARPYFSAVRCSRRAPCVPRTRPGGPHQVVSDDHQVREVEGAEVAGEVEKGALARGDAKASVSDNLFR